MNDPNDPRSYHEMDIQSSIHTIKRIIETGILSGERTQSPLFEAAITKILIELNDILQKLSSRGLRIKFTEDVDQSNKERDITDLISHCRNCACHISSGGKIIESNKFSFGCVIGKSIEAIKINGTVLGCEYEDDIAIFWGSTRLYLHRNIARAYKEVREIFPDRWSR